MLTKADINAIRRAERLIVNYNRPHGGDYAELVKDANRDDPLDSEKRHRLTCRVSSHCAREDAGECFEMINLYKFDLCPVHALRVGDEVTFEFYPDAGNCGITCAAGLHVDRLYILVTRGKRRIRYLLESSVCVENTARMCRGAKVSDWYAADAERARRMYLSDRVAA